MKQRDLMTQTTFCWLEKAACMVDINKHSELEVHACSLCPNGDVFVLVLSRVTILHINAHASCQVLVSLTTP